MQRFSIFIALSGLALGLPAFSLATGDVPTIVSSSLQSVMVYRNGAEMVHTAKARLGLGNSELIIDDVSTTLEPSSIRVGCDGSVTVLAVSFSKDYLQSETASPVVKKLQDSIDVLGREQERLTILTKSDEQLLDLLNSNKNIGGSQNGVSAAELAKMMEYYRQQQVNLRTELGGYADRAARLRTIRENLERQIREEESKNTKTAGRIALKLLCPMAGTYDFTVTYLTTAAHWEPAYDLKVAGGSDPLQLSYKARVVQSSGIDWKHVKLSLSTSMPSQSGNAPVLSTKFLRFAEAVARGYLNFSPGMANTLSYQASEVALREDADSVRLKSDLGNYLSINDNQLDVVFDIEVPYDIPSNGKEQGVVMKEYKVPCVYKDYAAPVAEREAYLLAQLQGWEKLNLLPGEASITVDGTYVGKSFIDPGSTQDTLNLTLGQDKRIVVKREKVTDFSSVKFLGSNKKEVFAYRITLRNNKKEKAQMLLKDQYPISTDKDIEVELLDSAGAMVNKDTGVLSWNVELAPGETRQYNISYSIKYPKDKTVNVN
ncbi:MAG TPA: DUF4139 domain-containing protein [Puia sp.]|nr:DUF4139 domain-containing protein [Puia sp.]